MKRFELFCILGVCLALAGCVSVQAINPKHQTELFRLTQSQPKTVLIAPADIIVYKLTAGGITEQMDEWIDRARLDFEQTFQSALNRRYSLRVRALKAVDLSLVNQELFKSQNALHRAVAQSIDMHVYSRQSVLSLKRKNFDYSLGPHFGYLQDLYGADMILFTYGMSIKATTGRWLMSVMEGLINLGLAGVISMPRTDGSKVYVSLIDCKSGDVIWFDKYYDPQGSLMPPGKAQKIAEGVVKSMPFKWGL